jgi:hypothetical protein
MRKNRSIATVANNDDLVATAKSATEPAKPLNCPKILPVLTSTEKTLPIVSEKNISLEDC